MDERAYWSKMTAIRGQKMHEDSYGEKIIKLILISNKIKFRQEVIKNLHKFDKDIYYCRLDFWLPKTKTVIEFNGDQHYKYTPEFHKSKEDFKRLVKRDKALRAYCKAHKYPLIVVRFSALTYGFDEVLLKAIKQHRNRNLV